MTDVLREKHKIRLINILKKKKLLEKKVQHQKTQKQKEQRVKPTNENNLPSSFHCSPVLKMKT